MNKVKYPDKKVIQQQICTIIDRSGMFDEQQDSQMFTEIKPVSRKHSYTRTAFKVVKVTAAAAAAVIVVTAVHGAATGIASKKQKALAPGGTRESEYTDNAAADSNADMQSDKNEGALKADRQYTSDEIAINKQDYLKYQKQTSCILGSDNSTIAAQLSVVYPKIYHNKVSLNSADSLYQTIADTCHLKAMEKYSDIDMSENYIENPVNISYTSTYSVCEAAQDTVLSFSDKYVESAESFIAKDFTRKRITQVYGYNFDVENDKILTYEDIFENYDEAMNYISERVMNAGASQIEYLDDQTNTYTYYNMKKIISDNNWYIKDYEMVITVNGRQTQKASGSSEYEVESPVQVSIDLDEFREKGIKFNNALMEIKKSVVGKDEVICKIMMAILARGHVLIEDIPGVGKTTMALAFAETLGLKCNRVQFTPDVMPSDIVGFNMYNRATNKFEYKAGAADCNILLADEINRTSPKTQSALLQVMEEGKVSVDGVTYALPEPFMVIATQNPFGSVGTQKLPESQMDRFMIRVTMGYPSVEDEVSIMKSKTGGLSNRVLSKNVINAQDFMAMRDIVDEVYVDNSIYEYVAKIVAKTRDSEDILQGISPRGSISIINMAKAEAFLRGHDYVLPSDIQFVLNDTMAHRIILNRSLKRGHITEESVIDSICRSVDVPKIGTRGIL